MGLKRSYVHEIARLQHARKLEFRTDELTIGRLMESFEIRLFIDAIKLMAPIKIRYTICVPLFYVVTTNSTPSPLNLSGERTCKLLLYAGRDPFR